MQGKELSEPEAATDPSVGIDVGKDWLDAHVLPAEVRLRVANSRDGIRRLKRWLAQWPAAPVVVEATGKWHRPLHRSLHAAGRRVGAVDPFRVRMFAKAHGILAKTDRLDARVLAMFAAMMAPPARPPRPVTVAAVQELVRARSQAVAQRTALHNQRGTAETRFLQHQLDRRLDRLEGEIAELEAEIGRRIAAEPALARRRCILRSIPGIGDGVAAILIADLPELGTATAKQIAALAGLAPLADDSGQRQGKRHIRGGRQGVRKGAYLAALAAVRANPQLQAFHRRLRDQGKPAKLSLVAVARKLLVLANTLIAENREWTPIPPHHA